MVSPEYGLGYEVNCTAGTAAFFARQPYVQEVVAETSRTGQPEFQQAVFPDNPDYPTTSINPTTPGLRHWNKDNYGRCNCPKKARPCS